MIDADRLLELGEGSDLLMSEHGAPVRLEIDDVEHERPTSANGSAIPGRRTLIARERDGTPWRLSVIYEFEGLRSKRPVRTSIQRGVEHNLVDGHAWEELSTDKIALEAPRGETA